MKRAIWFAFIILSTLVVVILLWQFSLSIVLFVLSLAIAAAVRPPISNLKAHGISRPIALGIVYSLVIGILLTLILITSPPLFRDLQNVAGDFAAGYERIKMEWPRGGSLFQKAIAEQLPPTNDLYAALTSEEGITAMRRVFGVAQNVFTTMGRIAIAILLSIYWSADQRRFEHLSLSLFPKQYHRKARKVWRSVETGVGAYVRSELIQSVLAGLILGVAYWFMGVRYPALLAFWVAIARVIPWFGAMIAVLPPFFVEIGSSPGLGILVSTFTVVVLLLMKWGIEPRFFLRKKYNSLLIILSVIALAEMFGIIGVMLAPPLAVAIQILFEQLSLSSSRAYSQETIDKTKNLKEQLSSLEKRIHERDEPVPDEASQRIAQIQKLTNKLIDQIQES